jgi:predicted aldo/keto reductase-like oxidoreductase
MAKTQSEIPRRPFGRTGESVSILGVGGWHMGVPKTDRDAVRLAHAAIERGVTFFDNAWDYNDGLSERRMGQAIADRRDAVFLMTKVCVHGRDAKVATRQLDESLRRLRTDYLDLWQIHEVSFEDEPGKYFARGGAVEALAKAKQQGKVRYVGFTGHKDPSLHLEMLSHGFPFDAVQMPQNCFDGQFRSFERRVLPELIRQGIAPIGMKSLGGDARSVISRTVSPADAIAYSLSLPIATLVSGIDSMKVLEQNVAVARGFRPLSGRAMQAIRRRVAERAVDGRFELYKIGITFDGPESRKQHGLPTMAETQD